MNNTEFLHFSLTRQEKCLGTVWLVFETLFFSALLQLLNSLLPAPLPQSEINFVFFCVNFAVIITLLRRYLSAQLQLIRESMGKILLTAVLGFAGYWALTFLFTQILFMLDPDFSSINDSTIQDLVAQNYGLMFFGTVILVPIAEECLFRGVVFRGLYDRSPLLAWIASVVLFALVHILGYIGTYPADQLLLCFVQYIPSGIFLAGAYYLSGSLLCPILIHATVNLIGMMALR